LTPAKRCVPACKLAENEVVAGQLAHTHLLRKSAKKEQSSLKYPPSDPQNLNKMQKINGVKEDTLKFILRSVVN
jgi:hypothetical protein